MDGRLLLGGCAAVWLAGGCAVLQPWRYDWVARLGFGWSLGLVEVRLCVAGTQLALAGGLGLDWVDAGIGIAWMLGVCASSPMVMADCTGRVSGGRWHH